MCPTDRSVPSDDWADVNHYAIYASATRLGQCSTDPMGISIIMVELYILMRTNPASLCLSYRIF